MSINEEITLMKTDLSDIKAAFDKTDLMNRLDGDMALAGELVILFIEDVENKKEAIRSAINRKDGAGIERSAHSLKGAAANLSAGIIRQLAYQLEIAGKENDMESAERFYADLILAINQVSDLFRREILNAEI